MTASGGSPASETPGGSRASETPGGSRASDVTGRRILGLVLPALGVLAAEPLYLLFDIAVVGRLGALPLAGLAIGGLILAQVSTQLTFLSYGTTARAARFHGADRHDDAVGEGVQATWLAMIVGLAILLVGQALAGPVARLLAGDAEIADAAVSWLRVALFGSTASCPWREDGGRPLALARARAVAGLLEGLGVDPSRVSVEGLGMYGNEYVERFEDLLPDGTLDEGQAQKNRRVVAVLGE